MSFIDYCLDRAEIVKKLKEEFEALYTAESKLALLKKFDAFTRTKLNASFQQAAYLLNNPNTEARNLDNAVSGAKLILGDIKVDLSSFEKSYGKLKWKPENPTRTLSINLINKWNALLDGYVASWNNFDIYVAEAVGIGGAILGITATIFGGGVLAGGAGLTATGSLLGLTLPPALQSLFMINEGRSLSLSWQYEIHSLANSLAAQLINDFGVAGKTKYLGLIEPDLNIEIKQIQRRINKLRNSFPNETDSRCDDPTVPVCSSSSLFKKPIIGLYNDNANYENTDPGTFEDDKEICKLEQKIQFCTDVYGQIEAASIPNIQYGEVITAINNEIYDIMASGLTFSPQDQQNRVSIETASRWVGVVSQIKNAVISNINITALKPYVTTDPNIDIENPAASLVGPAPNGYSGDNNKKYIESRCSGGAAMQLKDFDPINTKAYFLSESEYDQVESTYDDIKFRRYKWRPEFRVMPNGAVTFGGEIGSTTNRIWKAIQGKYSEYWRAVVAGRTTDVLRGIITDVQNIISNDKDIKEILDAYAKINKRIDRTNESLRQLQRTLIKTRTKLTDELAKRKESNQEQCVSILQSKARNAVIDTTSIIVESAANVGLGSVLQDKLGVNSLSRNLPVNRRGRSAYEDIVTLFDITNNGKDWIVEMKSASDIIPVVETTFGEKLSCFYNETIQYPVNITFEVELVYFPTRLLKHIGDYNIYNKLATALDFPEEYQVQFTDVHDAKGNKEDISRIHFNFSERIGGFIAQVRKKYSGYGDCLDSEKTGIKIYPGINY